MLVEVVVIVLGVIRELERVGVFEIIG